MNDEPIEAALAVRDEPAPRTLATISPQEARAAMEAYEELCKAVLKPEDYQTYTDRDGKTKSFKKKSAVKKLQTFFNIDVEVITTQHHEFEDGHFGWSVTARAIIPRTGRHVDAVAACTTFEEKYDITPYQKESEADFAKRRKRALARSFHDILGTAETRATNRAVMNIIGVGGGEVTAEEVDKGQRRSRTPDVADAADALLNEYHARPPKVTLHDTGLKEDTPTNRNRYRGGIHELLKENGITRDEYEGILRKHFASESSKEFDLAMLLDLRGYIYDYIRECAAPTELFEPEQR